MPEPRVQTCNDELYTVREAMRCLNQIVRCIEEGLIDKAVLTRKGKMVVAIVPLNLENRIKNLKAQRDDAVAVLRDLAWEGKIDGLSMDGVARLDDPTGVLGRAQAVLQEFPEAKAH